MAARIGRVWWASVLAAVGCVSDQGKLPLVTPSPFGQPADVKLAAQVSHSPASQEAALRVSLVGQKVLVANKQTGLKPVFHTVGAPTPEVFHHGPGELYVTEGLTKLCKTDAQLAAVLALEMGKMVSEREAVAGPSARRPALLPPPEARVGSDFGGTFGPPDGTRLAELSKFERQGGRPDAPLPPPPDPALLARSFLEKAGYRAGDLDEAAPVLKAARANVALEKQLASPTPVPARPWSP
jgi:hypothetical protein